MQAALLYAVRDALRSYLSLTAGDPSAQCEIMPDGRPPARASRRFYAVHPGDSNNARAPNDEGWQDWEHSLSVTITWRSGYAPTDRVGGELIAPAGGLLQEAARVAQLVHGDHLIRQAANGRLNELAGVTLAGESLEGFYRPLLARSVRWLGPVPGHWFYGAQTGDEIAGLACEVSFGFARDAHKTENLAAWARGEELPE